MNFRIVMETERSGKQFFYVQERFLFFFWVYLKECRDISMARYRIEFESLEEAENAINIEINSRISRENSKIVRREII